MTKAITSSFARTDEEVREAGNPAYSQSSDADVGSAPNVILGDNDPAVGTQVDLQQISVRLTHGANTLGAPTYQHGSNAPFPIVRDGSFPLQAGDTGGLDYSLQLELDADNSLWVLKNPRYPSGLGQSYIEGLETTNNSGDPLNDLDIAPGVVEESTGAGMMRLTSSLTKGIDAAWAEGSGGGFPSGLTLAADTWYRVFLIMKQDGTIDAGYDTNSDASALLADATDYVYYKRIDWVLTDGSMQITPAINQPFRKKIWDTPNRLSFGGNSSTTEKLVTPNCPPNQTAIVKYTATADSGASNFGLLSATIETDSVPGLSINSAYALSDDANDRSINTVFVEVLTNASSEIRRRETVADSVSFNLSNYGYIDNLSVL